MYCFNVLFVLLCVFSWCRTEISLDLEERDRLLNGFIEFINNLPDHQYSFEDGILLNAQETGENFYRIEAKLKGKDSLKYSKCTCTLSLQENGVSIQENMYNCEPYPVEAEGTSGDGAVSSDTSAVDVETTSEGTSEPVEPVAHKPIELDNEIRPYTEPTSGEQFVAIPREDPIRQNKVTCIGCGSHVDPQAPGVSKLAAVGVKQLDRHEPNVKHSLNKVIEVERQVQVVNGVRYILTVLIDFNNCTSSESSLCTFTKPCKISVLEKPWIKLPNGSKYRAILSNNCTETWLFGDNGEVLTEESDGNDKTDDSVNSVPNSDNNANTDSAGDIVKVIHNKDLNAQPNQKSLTDQELKNLEEQIIPYNQFETTDAVVAITEISNNAEVSKQNVEVKAAKQYIENANTENKEQSTYGTLSEEKKKAIDDLINFFDFAGFNTKAKRQTSRQKRSYDNDLKVMSLVENYKKVKKSVVNAKYIYKVAQTMVDFLNNMYMVDTGRTLKEVITAEEEFVNDHHFIYLQARVVMLKEGTSKDEICNGVIDGTDKDAPEVLTAFCYADLDKKIYFNTAVQIPADDHVLQKLINKALQKLESKSSKPNAMKVAKIISATTQQGLGVLTKISAKLVFLNCNKTTLFEARNNCVVMESLGSKICDIEIFQRDWLKETKIQNNCIETTIDESFSSVITSLDHISDKEITGMTKDALLYLETQSNSINRQKILGIKSVSTQLIAGLLTTVNFLVGYTKCKINDEVDIENCDLLDNEKLRYCTLKVWQRPWLQNSRDTKVTCDDNDDNIQTFASTQNRKSSKRKLNPNDEDYDYEMAKESLKTYMHESATTEAYEVASVDKVVVKVKVEGISTKLHFTIRSLDNITHPHLLQCYSEVWAEQSLDKKNINVDCDHDPVYRNEESINQNLQTSEVTQEYKSKIKTKDSKSISRQALGVESEKDVNDPKYKALAEESMQKYLESSGVTQVHKVISVDKVTYQVVAGSLTRLDFTIKPVSEGDVIKCHSEVWERPWLNKKEIEVNCKIDDQKFRSKRQLPGGIIEKDANDPQYKILAEESMQKYLKSTGKTQSHKLISVDRVTSQVVAGSLTRLDFTIKPVSEGDVIKCHSEVLEQQWLNKKEITVNCKIDDQKLRSKRQLPGGISERDAEDPQYKVLAEESMQKYLDSTGETQAHKVISVDKVTYQVVAGSLTRLDFTIKPVSEGDVIKCHSEVWERPWLNKKEIEVNCKIDDQKLRSKRQLPGGIIEKDANDPQYKILAEESMQKYLKSTGKTQSHKLISVDRVTSQVVAGSLTRLDFTIKPVSEGDVIKCHSEVLEQQWLNKKEITVNCKIDDQKLRSKRQLPGGISERDAEDPQYKVLAEESMQKYLDSTGETQAHKVISVDKVTYQVVAGSLTRLDFTIKPVSEGDAIKCHSEVWERPWLNKKEIEVNCKIDDQKLRSKRQLPGGIIEKDANDPQYKILAEESMQKYLKSSGKTQSHKIISVDRVTSQVVAGSLTRLDFTIKPVSEGDVIKCHSEVLEQQWLNKKEITVNCKIDDQKLRSKRQLPGGISERDAEDPQYKVLAEESMQKYLDSTGETQAHKVISVDKVTYQVVAGSLTRLDFTIKPVSEGDVIKCHSEVWERPWLNKKEIEVNCKIDDQKLRSKRQLPGGIIEKDANDPQYKILAEESMQKYLKSTGKTQSHKLISVDRVTSQVVAGSLTRLDFTIKPVSEGDVIKCHSEVLEQQWLNKKEITVNCKIDDQKSRAKRQVSREKKAVLNTNKHKGGIVEQDPANPEFLGLAEDSLHKYQQLYKSKSEHVVLEVKKVTTQVVAGTMYRINFVAKRTDCVAADIEHSLCNKANENNLLFCFSKVWSRPWLNKKNIDVSCYDDDGSGDEDEMNNHTIAINAFKLGVQEKQDVNKKEYHQLATLALKKYRDRSHSKSEYKVDKINHVIEQVTAGITTNIDFTALPDNCFDSDCPKKRRLHCQAEIWERPGRDTTQDVMTIVCKHRRKNKLERAKRQIDIGDNDIEDDMKYYYAGIAVQHINDKSDTDNLYKLVAIHALQASTQMRNTVIRMYIEVALTYCLRHQREDVLPECDEMDGVNHPLCLAKLYPSSDDDMIVKHVNVFCDYDENFAEMTGLSIPRLLRASIKYIEKDPNVSHKMINIGPPYVVPSLDSRVPIKINLIVAATNCTKDVDITRYRGEICVIDRALTPKPCNSYIFMSPHSNNIKKIDVECYKPQLNRAKRWISLDSKNSTGNELEILKLADLALQKLEMESLHRYKQKLLGINNYSSRITSTKETDIDFEVAYTTCLKYEWVDNLDSCQILEHLPTRHCSAKIIETLWNKNGQRIDVKCKEDERPLQGNFEPLNMETANLLAQEAMRHIEAKYPHPRKQKVARILSLEHQVVAGMHYRLKMEVGLTNCSALSDTKDCAIVTDAGLNKFCKVNVWIRPWAQHSFVFRVTCDYQNDKYRSMYETVQAQHLFFEFLSTYKPEYINDEKEVENRFNIFKDNVKKIHELNVRERGTATYGVTRFADLTYEEFTSKYLGLKQSLKEENNIPMSKAKIPDLKNIPSAFDWRDHGAVTEVKDQGSCGSCWAFSVTGNIEGQWQRHSGKLVSLSEQELVDCDKLDDGCNGGLPDNAYRAIEQLGGLELENDYPYEGLDDKCTFNKSMARVQISGAVNITSNETDMAKWLVANGPISIGINANAMQFYMGGVSHPWKMLCSPTNLDHGVLIVGYGIKVYPLFKKELPFWTIKNSWGKTWGEQGYYRVYRGDGTCGVNQMASSALV